MAASDLLQAPLLKLLAQLLNRQIERSATACARAESLEGAALAVHVTDFDRRLRLDVADARLLITAADAPADTASAADAELAGSLPALLGLFGPDPEQALRSGRIEVGGDGQTLADFRRLLELARPDWEEELAGVLGDVAAHQLARLARGLAGWSRRSAATLWQDLGEYLQEERRDLPTRIEADEFLDDVDRLRAELERLEARVSRLETRRTAG